MNENLNNENTNFKVLNMSIETLSLRYGLFLILWGIVVSFISGSNSFTSYIPTILGLPILAFSYLSIKFENKKKIFMHIVVIVALIVLLGGLDFIRQIISGKIFENVWADISKLMMLSTGIYFVSQCFRSFKFERSKKNS